jgi:transcriptional regulator with XRE-family HTH domain
MGRSSREKPQRLAEKLKQIRTSLGLTQNGILIRLGYQDTSIKRNSISGYERGVREPPLMILYAYANLANVYMEVLVDDALDLPGTIPSDEKSSGRKRGD